MYISVNGNQWKALALNNPYNVTHTTIIEFDIVVTDPGDLHGICLDSNLDKESASTSCVTLLKHPDTIDFTLTTQLEVGVPRRMVIPFGQIKGLLGGESEVVNYFVFMQDNDVADKRGGKCPRHISLYVQYSFLSSRKVF